MLPHTSLLFHSVSFLLFMSSILRYHSCYYFTLTTLYISNYFEIHYISLVNSLAVYKFLYPLYIHLFFQLPLHKSISRFLHPTSLYHHYTRFATPQLHMFLFKDISRPMASQVTCRHLRFVLPAGYIVRSPYCELLSHLTTSAISNHITFLIY